MWFAGFSVESGYFFDKNQLLYVSGAPGWEYVGQVMRVVQKWPSTTFCLKKKRKIDLRTPSLTPTLAM